MAEEKNEKEGSEGNVRLIVLQMNRVLGHWMPTSKLCKQVGFKMGEVNEVFEALMKKDGLAGCEIRQKLECQKVLATLFAMERIKQLNYGHQGESEKEATDFPELFYEQGIVFSGWKEKVNNYLLKQAQLSKINLAAWQEAVVTAFQQPKKVVETEVCTKCSQVYEKRLGRCRVCVPTLPPPILKPSGKDSWIPNGKTASIEAFTSNLNESFIRRYRWLDGGLGSTGVICIELKNEDLIIVKPSTEIEAELFATRLLKEIAGINAPNIQVLRSSQQTVFKNVLRKVPGDYEDFSRFSRFLSRKPYVLLMEFCEGIKLAEVSSETYETQPNLLHSIGRVIAFDMICNNFDRVPLIWNNYGNVDNMMYNTETNKLVVIDCAVTPIMYEEKRKDYQTQLISTITFLNQLVKDADFKPDSSQQVLIERLSTFFKTYTALGVSQEKILHVVRGILEGVKEIQNPATKTKMFEMTEKLRKDLWTWIDSDVSREISLHKLQEVSKFVEQNFDAVVNLPSSS